MDSQIVLLIYRDSSISLWDMSKGENVNFYQKLKKPISQVTLSKDQKTLYLLSNRGDLGYLNMNTGKIYKIDKIVDKNRFSHITEFNNKIIVIS